MSLGSLTSLLATAFAPIMLGLVFPDFLYVVLGPEANLDSTQGLNWGDIKSFLSYPAVESVPTDLQKLGGFNGRVGLHLYTRIALSVLSRGN
jgi:hypothetical protein